MPSTIVGTNDPKTVKRWSGQLAVDYEVKSYFTKRFIGMDDNAVIQRKDDLESDAGDKISFDLSVQLRNRPVSGDDRVTGNEENLRFFSDEVYIDQLRKRVSAGGKMTRKRILHDLRKVANARLSEYWAKYLDELMFIYLSGARGINEDFAEPTTYAGHAGNPIQAPDTTHIMYGGIATSKASLANTDTMTRAVVERVGVKTKMIRSLDPENACMMPVDVEGEKHFILLMTPFQTHQLKNDATAGGWLDVQKAAAAAEGRKNPIFKGALGMMGDIVLHEHRNVIRFNDYGAGSNVSAARALCLGRQAGVVAYGTPGGLRYSWFEEDMDAGNEPTVTAGVIFGFKKARFNSRDFGVIAVDTFAPNPG